MKCEVKHCGGWRSQEIAAMLRDLDHGLRDEWGCVPERSLFVDNVSAKIVAQIEQANEWHANLEDEAEQERARCVGDETDTVTAAMNRAKERLLVAFVRSELIEQDARVVVDATITRFADLADAPSEEEEEEEEPPALCPWLMAWSVTVLTVLYCSYYLLTVGSELGLRRSALWLVTFTIALLLHYAIVVPIIVSIFFVCIPLLIRSHIERAARPTTVRHFPYTRPCASSASYYLVLQHPELRDTLIARHVLETAIVSPSVGYLDAMIREIHHDTLLNLPNAGRILLFLLTRYLILDACWQEMIIEECLGMMPLVTAVFLDHLALLAVSAEATGRKSASLGSAMVLIISVMFIGAFAIIVNFTHRAHLKLHRWGTIVKPMKRSSHWTLPPIVDSPDDAFASTLVNYYSAETGSSNCVAESTEVDTAEPLEVALSDSAEADPSNYVAEPTEVDTAEPCEIVLSDSAETSQQLGSLAG